jgi:hypothetical protein
LSDQGAIVKLCDKDALLKKSYDAYIAAGMPASY